MTCCDTIVDLIKDALYTGRDCSRAEITGIRGISNRDRAQLIIAQTVTVLQ